MGDLAYERLGVIAVGLRMLANDTERLAQFARRETELSDTEKMIFADMCSDLVRRILLPV